MNPRPTLAALFFILSSCWIAAADDFSSIDQKIEAHIAKLELPGAGLLVIQNGKIVHEAFYGEYDEDTVIPIASATKWLTAATILTLVDDGTLKLDEPISTYLPAFAFNEKAKITTRHLLSHTSGISSSHGLPGGFFISPEECAQLIARQPLESAPDEFFAYGGQAMQVAAGIAEKQTGKSWHELVAERVTGPLRMQVTSFGPPELVKNPMAAGGALSSLRDYGKFVTMLSQGGKTPAGKQVLSEEALEAILSQQTNGAKPKGPFEKLMSIPRRGHDLYGLGCWIDRVDSTGRVLAASSPGAFAFTPWIDREHGIAGVFMVQTGPAAFLPTMKLVGEIQTEVRELIGK